MTNRFRKKPVEVEAMQWPVKMAAFRLNAVGEVRLWVNNNGGCIAVGDKHSETAIIETLEGDMRVSPGDWIIRGVKGEFYPCKPDIFDATYEPVSQPCRTDTTEVRQHTDADMIDWAAWLAEEITGRTMTRIDLESCLTDWRESRQ